MGGGSLLEGKGAYGGSLLGSCGQKTGMKGLIFDGYRVKKDYSKVYGYEEDLRRKLTLKLWTWGARSLAIESSYCYKQITLRT